MITSDDDSISLRDNGQKEHGHENRTINIVIITHRNIERSTLTASIALLVDSHGFLEYVDAVLLDERSSLNNQ